jgi:hypothetical protein
MLLIMWRAPGPLRSQPFNTLYALDEYSPTSYSDILCPHLLDCFMTIFARDKILDINFM